MSVRILTDQSGDCLSELEALMAKYPRGEFDHAIKTLGRRRVAADRPERIHLSRAKRNKLFLKYGGRCHICKELIDPCSPWHVDHVNAHLTGDEFNAERNLRPSHSSCNEVFPNSMSNDELAEQSGYKVNTGGFNNPRGRLRTLGLIEYIGNGQVRARLLLFPSQQPA